MNTRFCKPKDTQTWFDWCRSLLELYETNKQFLHNGEHYTVSYNSMQKWILAHNPTGVHRVLRTLLLDSMLSADKTPGAGLYVPWFLYNSVDADMSRKSSDEYKRLVLGKTNNKKAAQLFEMIYDLGGPLTKLLVKPSKDYDIVIRSRDCFKFDLNLDPQFHRMIGHTDYIEVTNPIVIMIEGAPETVAEIHPLLERNHESKRPVIIIARNFHEEISATLATNWIKNSLNVIPFVYGDSLSTINLAADMCSITKGQLISPHFGDAITIACIDKDKWGTVDRARWTIRGLELYANVDPSRHVSTLSKKAREAENEELREIINDRILSLSNDALEIWIPETDVSLIEELHALIQLYGAFCVSGVVSTPIGPIPTSFVLSAQSAAKSLREEILNIGGFLVRVEDEMVAG